MAARKPAPKEAGSPFKTADRLLKEDRTRSENERRLARWADAMIRERRLDPGWKEDDQAAATVRWISDRDSHEVPKINKAPRYKRHQG